jgi:predicted nucleic acid-binding protein
VARGAESFIDTNVFVYQLQARDPRKAEIANRIIRRAVDTGDACISFQVVQECLSTALRKAEIPLDAATVGPYLETVLAPLYRIPASLGLYQRALTVQIRFRLSFYDALIVSAALEGGCDRLWSDDLQHGLRVERLTVEDPFREA